MKVRLTFSYETTSGDNDTTTQRLFAAAATLMLRDGECPSLRAMVRPSGGTARQSLAASRAAWRSFAISPLSSAAKISRLAIRKMKKRKAIAPPSVP